jgi:hypothetical protein
MSKRSVVGAMVAATLVLSGCGLFGDGETITVAAAQEQFCSDMEQYVTAIGEYGGLFQDVELTVGDVKSAQDELEPAREAVIDSGNAFQEAVNSDPTAGVSIDLVEPESIEAVEEAEDAFADASEIDDDTPLVEAGVYFTSAAYQLEVAWTRLFADAGCVEEDAQAQAKQWVSDYVTAIQTDLSTVGYYEGKIDGIYGPMTIAAVEDLQRDSGLPVTGLLDPASQTVLQGLLGQRESLRLRFSRHSHKHRLLHRPGRRSVVTPGRGCAQGPADGPGSAGDWRGRRRHASCFRAGARRGRATPGDGSYPAGRRDHPPTGDADHGTRRANLDGCSRDDHPRRDDWNPGCPCRGRSIHSALGCP